MLDKSSQGRQSPERFFWYTTASIFPLHQTYIQQVIDQTLSCIIEANGTYIEDSTGKNVRHGVQGEAASLEKKKSEALPVEPVILNSFNKMLQ
jgi:hypothetical protein